MNTVSMALNQLMFTIPREVLEVAFKDENDNWRTNSNAWRITSMSLDKKIRNQVLIPRVLVDCNLFGGQTAIISMEGLEPVFRDNYNVVYEIPKARTQNRSIMSILEVGYTPYAGAYSMGSVAYGMTTTGSSNPTLNAAQRVGDAMSGIPPVSVGYVELVAENTILLRDQYRITGAYYARCMLENEENLNNINPRSIPTFSKLVELAVKSYIYNKLLIKIDQGVIYAGYELGAMKSYVESLSDSEEMYQTYLREKWAPTAYCNDVHAYDRFIKVQINPAI